MNKSSLLPSAVVAASLTLCLNLQAANTFQVEYGALAAQEDEDAVLVAIIRSGDVTELACVDYSTADVGAIAGEDYTAIAGTLAFAPGETVQTVSIPLLNDGLKEPAEMIGFRLTNPSLGMVLGAPSLVRISVKDNDPGVQFTWKHFWGHEVDGKLEVVVERGNDMDLSAFNVDYATSDDTALAGQDYTTGTGTLTFEEGAITKTITIPVTDDAEAESREQFQITLSNATGPGGLGGNITATLFLYDTTGHEPRKFGTVQTKQVPFSRRIEMPLLGRRGGNGGEWFELFGVEASDDLVQWAPQTWLAVKGSDLPTTFTFVYSTPPASSPWWHLDLQFLRLHQASALAAWPPRFASGFSGADPVGDGFVWRYPGTDLITRGVGYTERWVTDPTRRNRYGISDNSSFRVAIWYPGSPVVRALPRRLISSQEIGYWMDGWDYSSALPPPDMATYSFTDAPFRGEEWDGAPLEHPIVLYSHIQTLGSQEVCNLAEYLASRGYVVVVPDHSDCWTTTLEDEAFYGTTAGITPSVTGFQNRMRDFAVILDALNEWDEADPILQGQLDLGKIAAIGQQWGGSVAGELCRTVEACQGAVLVNVWGAMFVGTETLLDEGPGKPLLFIQHQGEKWKGLFDTTGAEAAWFEIADSNPNSLHSWAHWENAALNRVEQDREVSRTLHAYVESFLSDKLEYNDYGDDPALWTAPSDDYPNVINYERK